MKPNPTHDITRCVLLAFVVMMAPHSKAIDPIADWKTLVFPTLVPKAGMGNVVPGGMSSGTIRQQYETTYEEYWKETSYYDYNQSTGARIRGYYNDTKTYGYTQVPWAIAPPTGTSGGSLGGERFRDGWRRTFMVFNGRDNQPAGAGSTPTTDRFLNQWYFADACDNDDAWTPGESFFDRDGDKKWDPAVPSEDYWNSDMWLTAAERLQRRDPNTGIKTGNIPTVGTFALQPAGVRLNAIAGNTVNGAQWRPDAGEVFVDWNNNALAAQTVGSPGYDSAAEIFYHVAGQQVRIQNANELDFSPTDTNSLNEGDFNHTLVLAADPPNNQNGGNAVPAGATIPRNGLFDYTVTSTTDAQVFPMQYNGVAFYMHYDAYVLTNAAKDAVGQFYTYDDVWKPGTYPATPNLTNTNLPIDRVGVRKVRAFIYGTRELYGRLVGPGEDNSLMYGDEPGNPPPDRIVAVDQTWTDRTPGEKFEDFISFNDSFVDLTSPGGPGYIVTTNIGQVQNNAPQGRGRENTLSWNEYTQYIEWNYPGLDASLLARAGNGRYDGPEEWEESFSKKVAISDTTIGTVWFLFPTEHWLDQWLGFADWSDWYAELFGNNVTPAPGYPAAVKQAGTYTPVNFVEATTAQWIPNNTWAYDAPAEWADLPSSMYHLGGDPLNAITFLGGDPTIWQVVVQGVWKNPTINRVVVYGGDFALGEETSPWSTSANGQDLWQLDPTSPAGPDGLKTSAGPFGYNNIGINGFDGADVLTLETLTRKVDGVDGFDEHPIQLRDTNLDGVTDGGNTRSGQAYYNAGGDGSGAYPFNRQRFMEDVIANWDHAENLVDLGVTTTVPGSTLYGFPIYPNNTNAGWGALGGPAGATVEILTRDSTDAIGLTFQVRPMNGTLAEAPNTPPGTNGAPFTDFGMAILCHEQGHDIQGWPDLYDYDVWSTTLGEIVNTPVAGYDLMSGGGLVHGIANMKASAGWVTMIPLEPLIPVGAGPVTLDFYPTERIEDQYYQYTNPNNSEEFLDFWFNNNASAYGVVGGSGLYITHQDFSSFTAADPIQQRINGHFTWEVLQADGLNELQDAVNNGDAGDPFPGTSNNRTFSADGNPPARWWNQADIGLRILDVQLPTSPGAPARVTFERYDPSSPWPWIFNHADTDNDGIADVWELHYFGDLTTADSTSDYDLDGLLDVSEYLTQLDPLHRFSGDPSNIVDDSEYDSDGDMLSNGDEQNLHGTVASLPDTDDDGINDGVEVASGLQPTNSLSPLVDRVLNLTPSATNFMRLPNGINLASGSMNYALETFALEAWIHPRSAGVPADLFIRSLNSSNGYVNYRLRLTTTRQLELSFTHVDGSTNAILTAPAPTAIPLSKWTHVGASFNLDEQRLAIYINGQVVAWSYTPYRPMTGGALSSGFIDNLVGRNFDGMIDEVAIWDTNSPSRTVEQLSAPMAGDASGLIGYFRFDDGTHSDGVSGLSQWQLGEVENFVTTVNRDWLTGWANAGTLAGAANILVAPESAPVQAGKTDTDGDGLPDFWEILNGLDPNSAVGSNGGNGDPDGDGLSNYYEYLLGYNPHDADTDDDGVLDSAEDADGDGLTDAIEINTYGTRPDLPDTDDDGLADGEEAMGIDNYGGLITTLVPARSSSPIRSMDPVRMMSARFDGGGVVIVSNAQEQTVASWTVEAWVRPDVSANGVVVQHVVYNTMPNVSATAVNYEIGVNALAGNKLKAYVRYVGLTSTGTPVEVMVNGAGATEVLNTSVASNVIDASTWSHIAGSYDHETFTLRLYVNGEMVAYRTDALPPWGLTGDVDVQEYLAQTTIGGSYVNGGVVTNGFEGWIDDVAISSSAADEQMIAQSIQSRSVLLESPTSILGGSSLSSKTGGSSPSALLSEEVSGQYILRLKDGIVGGAASNVISAFGLRIRKAFSLAPIYHVEGASGIPTHAQLSEIQASTNVVYIETNKKRNFNKTPNDALYGQLWGLNNSAQTGGTIDADIDASAAWNRSVGSKKVVVAIIDSGCDLTHPDLAANIWKNNGEIPGNGIDDDGNGYVDDINGYDFINDDADPEDNIGHGTHVAGTVGAVGNNAIGVAGVNWNVSLMICKAGDFFLTDAAIIGAIEYAWRNGAKVSNNSYGGYGYGQGIRDMIAAAGVAGHLFVAAAANDTLDNDFNPAYPASYDLENIISVAATDHDDNLASFSNYGLNSVDLGAPGVGILSTVPFGYDVYDGTSMASPHVAGVAALLLAANQNIGYRAIKNSILSGVEPVAALDGAVATGGRLNAANSAVKLGSFVALYSFNDGGVTAEDSTYQNGWEQQWRTAGSLVGAIIQTNHYVQSNQDSDGDTLPDWWEDAMGLDSSDPSGINGLWGDADGDGLSNRSEYLGGTDPLAFDTYDNGQGDYYATNSLGQRLGEIYEDGDLIPDSYELQYPQFMSPLIYDANADSDGDGWDNLSEYRANTDPTSSQSHPNPTVSLDIHYAGTNAVGEIVAHFYRSSTMDGIADAIAVATVTQALPTIVTPSTVNGYIRQGRNWLFVFADIDGNSSFNEGEPAGIIPYQPVEIQHVGPVNLRVVLTDAPGLPGLPRFDWFGEGLGNDVTVRIVRTSSAGAPTVITRNSLRERSYFHEGDYYYSGTNGAMYGLDPSSSFLPMYSAYIISGSNTVTKNFGFDWTASLPAPKVISPAGVGIVYAFNQLIWSQAIAVTRNTIEIRAGATNGPVVYNSHIVPPPRGMNGTSVYDLPMYAGDGLFTNGLYYWRVIAANPRQTSAPSAWAQISVDLESSPVGAYSINGEVRYRGKNTNGVLIVQAFDSSDFSGVPHAQKTLSSLNSTYSLKGLRAGSYYVRAFIDQNGNKNRDTWESHGVVRDIVDDVYFFQPQRLELPGNRYFMNIDLATVDTDSDNIPDDWEFMRFLSLSTSSALTDSDGDGLSDSMEYTIGTNPMNSDSDGDGVSDGLEYSLYSTNPLASDSDGDGLSDGAEVNLYGSNPLMPDTDGDGLADGFEVAVSKTSPVGADHDGDGFVDSIEMVMGSIPTNAASKPVTNVLFAITSIVPGPAHDIIQFDRLGVVTNILYPVRATVEVKSNILQSVANQIQESQRTIYTSNWLSGPWGYTNVHSGAITSGYYNIRWTVPYP